MRLSTFLYFVLLVCYANSQTGYEIYEKEILKSQITSKYGPQYDFCTCTSKSDSLSNLLLLDPDSNSIENVYSNIDDLNIKCQILRIIPQNTKDERRKFIREVNRCLRRNNSTLKKELEIVNFLEEFSFSDSIQYDLKRRELSLQNQLEMMISFSEAIDTTSDTTCILESEKVQFKNIIDISNVENVYILEYDEGVEAGSYIGFKVIELEDEIDASNYLKALNIYQRSLDCAYGIYSHGIGYFRNKHKVYGFSYGPRINWNCEEINKFTEGLKSKFPEFEFGDYLLGKLKVRKRNESLEEKKVIIDFR